MEEKNQSTTPSNGAGKFKRLKRKINETTTYEDLVKGWTQCCFLLKNKGRLCNIGRHPNSIYCGNHITQEKDKQDSRIVCPLDPSHTVYPEHLRAHLKVCNAEKNKEKFAALPYFKHNCNSGTSVGDLSPSFDGNPNKMDFVKGLLRKIDQLYRKVSFFRLEKDSEKIEDPVGVSIREALGKGQTSFKHWKHIEQDVAIINKLISNSLVQPTEISENIPEAPKNIYVEYGAGKGLLGYSINVIDPTAALVFVERSGNRRKIDKFLAERNCSFQRLKLDIRHCFLPKLPFVDSASPSTNITVVAKHLCGAATDLAIRSLSHIGLEENGMLRKRGLAIATCCHHACTYDDYVGREIFLDECQITREEFDVLKYWAGWATLDDATLARKRFKNNHDGGSENASNDDPVNPEPENMAKSEEGNEVAENDEEMAFHKPSPSWNESYGSIVEQILDYQEMLEIGRKIKRILDFGRLLYLAQNLKLSPKLLQYCDEKYSPECYLLLATEQDVPKK